MRSITLSSIDKSLRGDIILQNLSLTIPSGKFFALLGPSGSGKTTLLRLIGGFETVDSGTIFLGSKDITHVPIHERRINTVFQQYALFPHMNVFDNVAYSLKLRNIAPDIIEQKVTKMLTTVGLQKYMYRSIAQLSGGQQQRVAIARAIINEPDVLLLDEPLAALDLKLREQMLIELIELQSQLGTTFIYVTHDQFEALTVADHMAIMNQDGQIEQVGTPKEIYEFPVSSFVATFVGTTNIFKGQLGTQESLTETVTQNSAQNSTHGSVSVGSIHIDSLGTFSVVLPTDKKWATDGATVLMSIRPEKIYISKKEMSGFSNVLGGTVRSIVYHGRSTQYNVLIADGSLVQVFEQNEEHFPKEVIDYDDRVYLYWQKENIVLLER
jgi:spermidine/putrescine transport system ATP-binding protein